MSGGECKIFERPEYQVLGQAQYDQDWIDGNTEAGVVGCGWQRPKVRPVSLQKAAPVARPAPKPKGFFQRQRERFITSPIMTAKTPVPQARPLVSFDAEPVSDTAQEPERIQEAPRAREMPAPDRARWYEVWRSDYGTSRRRDQ